MAERSFILGLSKRTTADALAAVGLGGLLAATSALVTGLAAGAIAATAGWAIGIGVIIGVGAIATASALRTQMEEERSAAEHQHAQMVVIAPAAVQPALTIQHNQDIDINAAEKQVNFVQLVKEQRASQTAQDLQR